MIKIFKYGEVKNEDIFARGESANDISGVVKEIIEDVRQNGDQALIRYSEKFDKAKITDFMVSDAELDEAVSLVEPEFLAVYPT